jgi:hypothetical protein
MSSDEDEGDGRRVNRYESDDEGDVEGTFDEDAWNDSRTRNRGRTKEQAIYGIFGSDEDDDDDRTRGGRGAPVDYAAPMNFKSADGGGAGLGAGETPTDMFAEHHDEHHRAPPTAGLGARGGIGSGAGLGSFAPQGGAGLGFGGFSKGSTITSTVGNEGAGAGIPGARVRRRRRGTGIRIRRRPRLRARERRRRRGRRSRRGRSEPHGR